MLNPPQDNYDWQTIAKQCLKTSPSFIIKAMAMSSTMLLRPKIIGMLGNEYLAVSSELHNYELLVFKLCFGLQAPVLQLISKAKQQQNIKSVGLIYRSALLQAGLLLPLVVGICLVSPRIMQLTKQPDIVLEEATTYFMLSWVGVCIDLFVNQQNQTLLGVGRLVYPNITDCLGNALYLLTAYGLVAGNMGLPKLKFTGLALSLILTKSVLLILKQAYIVLSKLYQEYKFYEIDTCSSFVACSDLRMLFSKGSQIGGQGVLDVISPMVLTTLLGIKGTHALVAMQASTPFSMLITVPNFYFAHQVNILMSQAIGLGDVAKVRALLKFSLLASMLYGITVGTLLMVFAKSCTGMMLDNNDPNYNQYLELASNFLRISVVKEFFDGISYMLVYSLWAHLDTKYTLASSLFLTTLLTSGLSIAIRDESEEKLFATPILAIVLSLVILGARAYYLTCPKPLSSESNQANTKGCFYLFNRFKKDKSGLFDSPTTITPVLDTQQLLSSPR